MTRAYSCAPAAEVGPFLYTIVVFAGLIGWLFWYELPDLLSLSGTFLVVIAGMITISLGGKTAAPAADAPDTGSR